MKILGAKVIVCSPGRNFVTLKVETDEGIYGLGDATLNGRELAVAGTPGAGETDRHARSRYRHRRMVGNTDQ